MLIGNNIFREIRSLYLFALFFFNEEFRKSRFHGSYINTFVAAF